MSKFRNTDKSYPMPVLSKNSLTTLEARYYHRDEAGKPTEDARDLFYRVAACVAEEDKRYGGDIEKTKRTFYDLMASGTFLPNSPALMNAGLENGNLFGACIHGDAPVLTKTGYVPMKEVVLRHQQGIYQEVSNGAGRWVPVLAAVSKGVKPVYRNYIGPSRSVDSTLDHRFSTFVPGEKIGGEYVKGHYKWEEIGNIPIGNKLRFGEQGAQVYNAEEVDSEVAIAAWILTDGGCGVYPQSKGGSTFFVAEIQVIDDLSLANVKYHLNKLGISFTESDEEDVNNVERFTRIRSYDRNLEKVCEKFGLFSRKSTKKLSSLIDSSSYSSKIELLRIMFEADGSISTTGLEYSTVSKDLAYSVSGLLDLVGVSNNVYFRKETREGRLDGWRVCVNHTDSIIAFSERVGFISSRKNVKLSAWPVKEAGPARIKLMSREYLGDYEVFDIQTAADGDGSFVVNGILVHNCFVLPIEDSIEGIFNTVKATAMVQKAGGGTGFSFDRLRPTGDFIKSSGGTTSGPISFWRVLYETTNAIQQGSKRRGANMGMMSITHPDILKFITAKQDLSAFTNYNISVKISDAWMDEYKKNPEGVHVVMNQRNGKKYAIPRSIIGTQIMKYEISDLVLLSEGSALNNPENYWTKKEVFDIILSCAWATGEPGLFFIDRANKYNPTPHIGEYEATNPCGEQVLLPYESCNLGSINVAKFYTSTGYDWERLRKVVYDTVHFLDNVVDASPYPIPEIEKMCQDNRKIGLGIMGFADLLFLMNTGYNTQEARDIGAKLMKFINDASWDASEKLAETRGTFPNYKGSQWEHDWVGGKARKVRNAVTTTVAPTGTISIIANCSGGIEPLFSLVFMRQVLGGKKLPEVNGYFEKYAKEYGFYSEELMTRISENGTIQNEDTIPDIVKKVFVCAQDIDYKDHVKMQAAFQEHCGSSISKTINMLNSATKEEVEQAYLLAYDLGCKGITVYRDGCRSMQPMALVEKKPAVVAAVEPVKKTPAEFVLRKPAKTPDFLPALRLRQNTPFGHMHVNVTLDPKTSREFEVFAQLGKAGDHEASNLEAISRLISLYLRLGGSLTDVIDQLSGIGSSISIPSKDGAIRSISDALAKVLNKYREAKNKFGVQDLLLGNIDPADLHGHKKAEKASPHKETVAPAVKYKPAVKDLCPSCGSPVQHTEKCLSCPCGWSKCS